MTDEDSRKAFQEWWSRASSESSWPWNIWQASAEYHTKRERERCLKIAWTAHEDGKMRLRYIREMEQEPKL